MDTEPCTRAASQDPGEAGQAGDSVGQPLPTTGEHKEKLPQGAPLSHPKPSHASELSLGLEPGRSAVATTRGRAEVSRTLRLPWAGEALPAGAQTSCTSRRGVRHQSSS